MTPADMNWADLAILIIILLSSLISILRGFVREALSLAGLIIAFWVAFTFSKDLSVYLAEQIKTPSIQIAAAFAILFIVTLILAAIVNYLAGQLVKKSGLSGSDRMLGIIFGVVRGVAVVAILVLLAGLTPLPQDAWWNESLFVQHFQELAIWLRGFLPADIASNFVYDVGVLDNAQNSAVGGAVEKAVEGAIDSAVQGSVNSPGDVAK
ncbi:MAG: hypothetical protein BMS9Abin26_1326 [Gammaproteobacteria bacterium]|nr:MAG: hypothetical protein BMS9Abin26_1326 [Gammaproteobacteria bacterium]